MQLVKGGYSLFKMLLIYIHENTRLNKMNIGMEKTYWVINLYGHRVTRLSERKNKQI